MADFRIEYDDQILEIVEKISAALEKKHGLTIVFDDEDAELDGYEEWNIIKKKL